MDQIERIIYMEHLLNEGLSALSDPGITSAQLMDITARLQELFDYYFGPIWRQDLADDRAGKLPADLKRGVLSEDAVYDLFTMVKQLHIPPPNTDHASSAIT